MRAVRVRQHLKRHRSQLRCLDQPLQLHDLDAANRRLRRLGLLCVLIRFLSVTPGSIVIPNGNPSSGNPTGGENAGQLLAAVLAANTAS